MREPTILIIDDDKWLRELVGGQMRDAGYRVETAATGEEALGTLSSDFHGVIVLDVQLTDTSGPELFPLLRQRAPGVPIVFLTGHGSTDLALQSIQQGAYEFVEKEHIGERLVGVVDSAVATLQAPSGDHGSPGYAGIVAESPEMREVFRSLEQVVESRIPVLIRGESGSGKELIARALHDKSPRATGPFVAVNCAGIPDTLLESELFGYEKGAFTGATQQKPGRFDLAQGGTLLLDEIGEMQPTLQAKLLRVLQEGEYERLGGTRTIRANLRIVSATHRDLEFLVSAGEFREDLYYRLSVFTIHVPALRERPLDVSLLALHFMAEAARRERKTVTAIDSRAMELLQRHHYPGNVRELQNILSYAVVSARGSAITIANLPPAFRAAATLQPTTTETSEQANAPASEVGGALKTLQEVERQHIELALARTAGNKTDAATMLGISRMTLYRKLEAWAAETPSAESTE